MYCYLQLAFLELFLCYGFHLHIITVHTCTLFYFFFCCDSDLVQLKVNQVLCCTPLLSYDIEISYSMEYNCVLFIFRETKIVLKGLSTVQLADLAAKATSLGLPNYSVEDAGRTQVRLLPICFLEIKEWFGPKWIRILLQEMSVVVNV